MENFLDQSQKNMMNFSINIFCSVVRPLCSNLDAAPPRKMIKMQDKFCWKLNSDIFPTPLTSYFYHF